jgi:hypothetical protein
LRLLGSWLEGQAVHVIACDGMCLSDEHHEHA